MKINEVVFINEKLNENFEKIKKGKFEEKRLVKLIERAIVDLKEYPFCGIRVPRELTPKKYLEEYGIKNIWKYNLPNGWRLIYTISANEIRVVSIILEWFNHKEYERRFNY